jgi:hypothetical protein
MAKRTDWATLKATFIQQPTTTCAALAAEHGISRQAVQWHCRREDWVTERCHFLAEVEARLVRVCADSAAEQLRRRNEEQLRQNEELREILDDRLMYRRPSGVKVAKTDVSIAEVVRAIAAFGELYRCDRLVLGADNIQPAVMRDRFAEMTSEELEEELRRVRAEMPIQ